MSLLLALTGGAGPTSYSDTLSNGSYVIVGQNITDAHTSASIDGGGGRYWQTYWMDKRGWEEKIPKAAVKAIERVARSNKTGESAEQALMLELEDYQARYSLMLRALQESQFNTLRALQAEQIRLIQDKEDKENQEDEELLLLLG
jgi:hypothetical protein